MSEKTFGLVVEFIEGAPDSGGTSENPAPTKTWSECIRCPECKTEQWAMVEQEYEMPFPFYRHDCQHCGHTILESEWERVEPSGEAAAGSYHDRILHLQKAEPPTESAERHYGYGAGHRSARYAAADIAAEADARIAELEARLKEAEKLSVHLRGVIVEHEKSNVGIMESYDRIESRATAAESRCATLEAALKAVEWIDRGGDQCEVCHNERREGHMPNCAIAAALSTPQPDAAESEVKG